MGELTRWHRAWFVVTALMAAGVALACLPWPEHAADVLPITPKALHARCIGALYLAAALGLAMSEHVADIAAVRIPMALVIVGAAGMALAGLTVTPLPGPWLLLHTLVALSGAWLRWLDGNVQAPAERPDRGLLALASLAAVTAALLALVPQWAAALWPWPLPRPVTAFYAAPLVALSLCAWLVARERRRDARRIALWVLAAACTGLLVASALHRALFAGASAWVWFALIGAAWALVLQRLLSRNVLVLPRSGSAGRRGKSRPQAP